MHLPDLSKLDIQSTAQDKESPCIPDDIVNSTDPKLVKLKNLARILPYPIESNEEMQRRLELILLRITQCVEAKDYYPGLINWDVMLSWYVAIFRQSVEDC